MKRTACAATVLASLVLGCSSSGKGSGTRSIDAGGTGSGNGGAGASSQVASGSGGTQQAGSTASGGTAGTGGGSAQGGASGLAGTTGSGASAAGPGGNSSGLGGVRGAGGTTGAGGSSNSSGGTGGAGGTTGVGGTTGSGGATGSAGMSNSGGTTGSGGSGGIFRSSGTSGSGGVGGRGTTASAGGSSSTGGSGNSGGTSGTGGVAATGGSSAVGGSGGHGGSSAAGGTSGTSSCGAAAGSDPVGVFNGALATGITFKDTDGNVVNTHGGGIIQVCDTFYMHGLYFPPGPTPNDFNGVSMYSSKDLATWKNEGIVLPVQPAGSKLGPNRNCDRPHIIQCPKTGEFVLYARSSDDVTFEEDKEVVYATSPTVNAVYTFQGSLLNASGQTASHSDMSAYADDTGAYFVTESGWVYPLADDCHSWVSGKEYSAVNGLSGGGEAPTIFRVGGTYYWIASYKTGWRCNNNFYSTAPAMTGPWTYQGFIAPVTDTSNDVSPQQTWLSQTTWVQPVVGSKGTVYLYWGDHWDNCGATSGAGSDNSLATFVFQPLIFDATTTMLLPTYLATWSLDVGAGTWSQ